MTMDQALAALLKAFVPLAVAGFLVWSSVAVVAPVVPVAIGWLAGTESALKILFALQLIR